MLPLCVLFEYFTPNLFSCITGVIKKLKLKLIYSHCKASENNSYANEGENTYIKHIPKVTIIKILLHRLLNLFCIFLCFKNKKNSILNILFYDLLFKYYIVSLYVNKYSLKFFFLLFIYFTYLLILKYS